jgi:hypothetical protein
MLRVHVRRQEADAAARLAEEEEMAQRVEERVRARVEAALGSPEVQARVEARLLEERTALEQKARGFTLQHALLCPAQRGLAACPGAEGARLHFGLLPHALSPAQRGLHACSRLMTMCRALEQKAGGSALPPPPHALLYPVQRAPHACCPMQCVQGIARMQSMQCAHPGTADPACMRMASHQPPAACPMSCCKGAQLRDPGMKLQ